MPPSISIVATCYNYGHFLDACLDSLQAQTRRPDEIIVVDDGSTDATASVLRARTEPLAVIHKENGGQASAFNAGFARTTGDIVLFLDADDTLEPDALELIAQAWHDSFSAINFRLNLIDPAGRLTGFYAAEPDEGDMRPELLARGHFEFMPTSGNAFNRRLIAPAFPLPEARWRVSADAVLVRAAALAGPMKQLPFALGNYRAHGANAYHRTVISRVQSRQRAVRDMADACLAVARMRRTSGLFGSDPDIVRLELVLAFLRRQLSLPPTADRKPQRAKAVRSALGALLRLRIGWRAKAVFTACLASSLLAPRVDRWIVAPETRPRAIGRAIDRAFGRKLVARRRDAQRPRWLEVAGAGQFAPQGARESGAAYFIVHDWRVRAEDGARVLCGDSGEIILPLAYFPRGGLLDLDVRAIPPFERMPLELSVSAEDELLGTASIKREGQLPVVLEPKATLSGEALRLVVSVTPRPETLKQRWLSFAGPRAVIEVAGFAIEAVPEAKTGIMLSLGEHRAFSEIAHACQISPPPQPNSGWPHLVEGADLALCLVRPRVAEPLELVVRFSSEQVEGSLVITDHAAPIYRGWIGPAAVVHVPISPRYSSDDSILALSLNLDLDDPFAAPGFHIATVGLVGSGSSLNVADPSQFPVIGSGQVWRLEEEGVPAATCLGENWTPGEEGAELFDTLGMLRFSVGAEAGDDAVVHLLIGPSASLPEDAVLAVAVSIGAQPIARILLQDEQELAVPLGDVLASHGRRIELALHAALSSNPDEGETTAELGRGGLLLRAIRLTASPRRIPATRTPQPSGGQTLSGAIAAAGAAARALGVGPARHDRHGIAELAAKSSQIASAIRTLAPSAAQSILLDAETLATLCDLGEVLSQYDELPADEAAGEPNDLFALDPATAARALALALIAMPPWQALAGRDPAELSNVLRAFPSQLARYLCSIRRQADPATYGGFIRALLENARDCFVREPKGSRGERLAEEIVRQARLDPLFAMPEPLRDATRALGAAIEAHLLRRGRRITLPRGLKSHSVRPRLGAFLRVYGDGAEADLLRATIRALASDRFELVVFTLGAGAEAAEPPTHASLLLLDGAETDRAVETMRAAALDIFLNFASFDSYDDVAAILAHRLAPVAVAATVSPAALTTGLRSFDVMVTPSSDRPDLIAGCTERVVSFAPRNAVPTQRPRAPSGSDVAAFGAFLAGVISELATADAAVDPATLGLAADTNDEQARNTNRHQPRHN